MKFVKMHGCGNDYIVLNCLKKGMKNYKKLARNLCNRRFGVGGDGTIFILNSKRADARMRIFNPDGSEAEMCGNGIRCVGKYLCDYKVTKRNNVSVETLDGIKRLNIIKDKRGFANKIEVDMGSAEFEAKNIPVRLKDKDGRFYTNVINVPIKVMNKRFLITCVGIGNPHCVIFVDDVENFEVEKFGRAIENNNIFPNRTNVEFVTIVSRKKIIQRTWERGVGETLACGTGACAAVTAGLKMNILDRKVEVKLNGGTLDIEITDETILMTGPAVEVFEGEFCESLFI